LPDFPNYEIGRGLSGKFGVVLRSSQRKNGDVSSFVQTAKRVLKIIWRAAIGLFAVLIAFLILFLLVAPFARGWGLHHQLLNSLKNASSVKVVEHSCRWDGPFDPNYKEITYATVPLNHEQIVSLEDALQTRWDCSGLIMTACIFEEHHYIEIKERDGSVVTLHICFHCGEIVLNNEDQRIMPLGWHSSLGKFITSIGLHPEGPWGTNPDATK